MGLVAELHLRPRRGGGEIGGLRGDGGGRGLDMGDGRCWTVVLGARLGRCISS